MGKRRGRKPKTRDEKLSDALKRVEPNAVVMERRRLFAGIAQPPADKRLDGRNGEIDSEVCDAIGQMCALGLLDGHGHDPVEMRDKGRFWGCHYARLMKGLGAKTGSYERADKSQATGAMTPDDLLFDRMDRYLPSYERQVLLSLLVDPLIGHDESVPWAQSLIDETLLARKRIPNAMRFPGEHDRELLRAAIRGLVVLVDGSLPVRRAA